MALQEVIDAADATRGPLHVVHINSMGLGNTPKFLQTISEAQSRGLDVTTECYPYTAAATGIESALFNAGWKERLGIDYKDLEWAATGERLTEGKFKFYRQTGGIVIIHLMSEDMIQLAVAHPLTTIASDSLLQDGKGHPRSAGTFCRVLGQYVREKKALTLMEALRKMTLMPAQRLEALVPAVRNKGRIRVGAAAGAELEDVAAEEERVTSLLDVHDSAGRERLAGRDPEYDLAVAKPLDAGFRLAEDIGLRQRSSPHNGSHNHSQNGHSGLLDNEPATGGRPSCRPVIGTGDRVNLSSATAATAMSHSGAQIDAAAFL